MIDGMTDTPVAWKFLAETTEPDGQIVRRYCYVAILDRDAARHANPRGIGFIRSCKVRENRSRPMSGVPFSRVPPWIVRCVLSPEAPPTATAI